MADNLKDELRTLMDAHHKEKAEAARIAKQAQERIAAEELAHVRSKTIDVELPQIREMMRIAAQKGKDSVELSLGQLYGKTFVVERADIIESTLRREGITKIVRRQVNKNAEFLDDVVHYLNLEIGW